MSKKVSLTHFLFKNSKIAKKRLLNVAFSKGGSEEEYSECPDRKTGVKSFEQLRKKFSEREWKMVLIDVREDKVSSKREEIMNLIYPKATFMDINISSALWFASRGIGKLFIPNPKTDCIDSTQFANSTHFTNSTNSAVYHSRARLLFSGLGADELLGGYSRHRSCFKKKGEKGLEEELEMDLERIYERNCGRDDRIFSSNSVEVRFPFLDEDVVSFLSNLKVSQKCDLREAPGVGDKKILRMLAKSEGIISNQTKRAIHFGTRIAKIFKSKNGEEEF